LLRLLSPPWAKVHHIEFRCKTMLPRFGYSNMMGLDMTMPIMGHSHNTTASLLKPYLTQGSCLPMTNMEVAAILDSCDARARIAEAQVAQLLQLMELNQHNQGLLPTGVPMWQGRSHQMPEAQLPQRALQQAFGGAWSEQEKMRQYEFEGSQTGSQTGSASASASDEVESTRNGQIEHHLEQEQRRLAKKLRPKQTLRGYLEELRSENPRCIFIVRRINKLGFRSKSALESHYSKFGKVLQVCVAHSKVKPLPNSGQTARTRPGNFGLVVMQSPQAVKKVLDKGSVHVIDGVEVSVHKYEPSGLDGMDGMDDGEIDKNEAAELIQMAKHQLTMLIADCKQRMAELSMNMDSAPLTSVPQMPFDASLGAPPGFGRGHYPGLSAEDF